MDETILREILAAQKDMLAELRQIRTALTDRALLGGAPLDLADHPDVGLAPGPDEPAPPDVPELAEFTLEPEMPPQPAGTFTPSELKELGKSFDQPVSPKSRSGLVDVQDLRGSLLDEIKGKNRAKSRAFAEFSKLRRDD
jgi:hypothetical protein